MLTQIEKSLQRIAFDICPPAGRIVLSHPPLNVIDLKMMEELLAAVEQLDQRADVSFFVLTGSPKAFSAGISLEDSKPDRVFQTLESFNNVFERIAEISKPLIVAVNGPAIGAGSGRSMPAPRSARCCGSNSSSRRSSSPCRWR